MWGIILLDVCDRLSCDMNLFMSRRAFGLSARQRERDALLAALQGSVSSIWPGRCHVELYGSCATQLDLPASDIDVVILGLDSTVAMMMNACRHKPLVPRVLVVQNQRAVTTALKLAHP